ncbi:MAG: hypothetical protein IH600_15250 [Bacteroidetes bacterium]|nr:hypothetical protein [Bacteroidota bacterium]
MSTSKILLFLVVVATTAALFSCDDGIEEPEAKSAFHWRYDSLGGAVSFGLIKFWGDDPRTLYLLSGNALYRYDRPRFHIVPLMGVPDSPYATFYDIAGSSDRDLWVAGECPGAVRPGFSKDSSCLLHYDGSQWREVDLACSSALFAAASAGEGEVFLGGNMASLIRYANGVEEPIFFPLELRDLPYVLLYCSELFYNDGILYASGWVRLQNGMQRPFRFEYENGSTRFAGFLDEDLGPAGGFWRSTEGTLYALGRTGVLRKNGNRWETYFIMEPSPSATFGTTEGNIWVTGYGLCRQWVRGKWVEHNPTPYPGINGSLGKGWTDGNIVMMMYQGARPSSAWVVAIGE